MEGCTIRSERCVVCGSSPVQMHHVVKRSAGNMYRDGVRLHRPQLALCGLGNASGCHGLAHQNRLHFRWVKSNPTKSGEWLSGYGGHWEYLLTDEPVKYQEALEMEGWQRL